MSGKTIHIQDLMVQSNVKFGTSGARGLVKDMTDEVCYAYTLGFVQHLEQIGELAGTGTIAVGGDLRQSTDRIMTAVAKAVTDRGYGLESCGKLPSPALALYGIVNQCPTVMVTGSHIPDDRNGIKYTKAEGEILKRDELGIKKQTVDLPEHLFDERGFFRSAGKPLLAQTKANDMYLRRYLDCFPQDCLKGKHIGVYQHSAVGRDLQVAILKGLGAEVTAIGRSDIFIPVDTEAIRSEDVEAAADWSRSHGFDAIVSTDGDSDRPLVSDENGKWLRGDVAGILCSEYLNADVVVAPVSCNTALEKSGIFKKTIRTRIGSPYVIEGMQQARNDGAAMVVGYEANGGFLLETDYRAGGSTLRALPTRDAVIVHLGIVLLSIRREKKISALNSDLPQRFTASDRLKEFPTEKSKAKIAGFIPGTSEQDFSALEADFGKVFGKVQCVDVTDGLRVTFESAEIVHLRPSGNAPEFRCYTEASSEDRAAQMNKICTGIMEKWR